MVTRLLTLEELSQKELFGRTSAFTTKGDIVCVFLRVASLLWTPAPLQPTQVPLVFQAPQSFLNP